MRTVSIPKLYAFGSPLQPGWDHGTILSSLISHYTGLFPAELGITTLYSFYHMVLNEIESDLQRCGLFIEYIITELSLTQTGGKLLDRDSNYFRHLLSNENFKLLKYRITIITSIVFSLEAESAYRLQTAGKPFAAI